MLQFRRLSSIRMLLVALCLGLWLGWPALASTLPQTTEVDWVALDMGLFGGLALFLLGLEALAEALTKAAGDTLKYVLEKLTSNRFAGALTGAFVTGVLNSSSITTVLVVGFVTSGVMTLSQSVGVIMGANIGSTVTAQILAFNISAYSLAPVAIGFFMQFVGKSDQTRYYGRMIMGLGLVFYGMGVMSDGMRPLRTYQPFMDVLASMENPMLGILAGAVFTGLVQSSAATVGIAIAMATEGLLSLPAGIALALGANIGTCVTALLAAIGKPPEAVRAAVVHIGFNILGVLVWLPFLHYLADVAVYVSPVAEGLSGTDKLVAEVPRQIANANTIFNVANTLLFIGFTTWFARLAIYLVPDKAKPEHVIIEPLYLDAGALKAPTIALENVRHEIQRAGKITLEMMDDFRSAYLRRDIQRLDEVIHRDDEVDVLDKAIFEYLGEIRRCELTEEESHIHQQLMSAMSNLESLADVMETSVVDVGKTYLQQEYPQASLETQQILNQLWRTVRTSVFLTVKAIGEDDPKAARDVLLLKDSVRDLSEQFLARHAKRLSSNDPQYVERLQLLMSLVEHLRYMYTLAKRAARTQLPQAVLTDTHDLD